MGKGPHLVNPQDRDADETEQIELRVRLYELQMEKQRGFDFDAENVPAQLYWIKRVPDLT